MPNIDAPIGLFPVRHLTGGEIRTNSYRVKANTTIFKGDPVVMDTTGTVMPATANPTAGHVIGVAAEYVVGNASGTSQILIYDDPYIVFGIQSSTGANVNATDVFLNARFKTDHAGVPSTGLSGYELDSATLATTSTHELKVIGKCDSRKSVNNFGENHVDLLVIINNHNFKSVGTVGL